MGTPAHLSRSAAAKLKAGDHIGQYEIVEPVGFGGYGSVYKVKQGEGVYVLKLLTTTFLDDAVISDDQHEARLRADREFFALRSLDHPNVMKAYAFERWPELTRGWPYIVTEYVDGEDLEAWCEKEEPSLRRICSVLAKVAGALAHVHAAGLFHRDVKAGNVLVRRGADEPVLIDLGLVRNAGRSELTAGGLVMGTKTHLPPEYVAYVDSPANLLGESFTWTVQVDLYAFGFMAYEILTGRPPVADHDTETALFEAIRKGEVPLARAVNGAIPEALSALVMRLVEKDPAKRPGNAEEVQRELEAFLAEGRPELDGPFVVPMPPEKAPAKKPEAPAARYFPAWVQRDMAREARANGGREARDGDEQGGDLVPQPIELGPELEEEKGEGTNRQAGKGKAAKETSGTDEAIRRAEERLAASSRQPPLRILLVAGGLVAAGLVALMAFARSGTPPKDNLLARLEREEAHTSQRSGRDASGTSGGSAPAATREAKVAPVPLSPPSVRDAQDIDAAIATRYGRPTIPEGGLKPGEPVPGATRPSSLKGTSPVRRVAMAPAKPADEEPILHAEFVAPKAKAASPDGAPKTLGISMGTHIKAKLVSNLDSRTIGAGPVEAVLPVALVLHGGMALPAGTHLYGKASAFGDRFGVDFTHIKLPDDTECAFDGLAWDRGDNKPGLAAGARINSQGGGGEEDLGSEVARGTGNIVLNAVSGGLVEDTLRGAGSTVVNHRSTSQGGSGGSAILLEAGVLFDVFVTKSF